MNKVFKYSLVLLGSLLLVGIIYMGATFPPVLAAYAAKTMCSCTYVMGRAQECVVRKEKTKSKPNKFFEYSSGTANLLSKIIRQSLGDSLYYRFPYERLFYKIGMYHTLLEPDASGTFVGSSCGYGSARDWARFGLLYLNDGVWNGERILPEGWVKYSSTPVPAAPIGQYGAQFWLNAGAKDNYEKSYHPGIPHDEFGAEGFEEQSVFIIPSQKLVVVRLGISHHGFDIVGLTQKIMSALPETKSQ